MIHVVNRSETSQILPQKGKSAIEILAGQSAEVDIGDDHPAVVAKVGAGLISIVSTKAEAKKALDALAADAAQPAAEAAKPIA